MKNLIKTLLMLQYPTIGKVIIAKDITKKIIKSKK
jgi:hypothetical protein